MNNMELYEKIPEEEFPIRLLRNPSSDFRFAPHWHEHTEIHFIFEGTARIKCGDKLAVDVPNAETLAAIDDVNNNRNMSKAYDDMDELMRDLNA